MWGRGGEGWHSVGEGTSHLGAGIRLPELQRAAAAWGLYGPGLIFFIASRSEVRFGGMQSRQAVNG